MIILFECQTVFHNEQTSTPLMQPARLVSPMQLFASSTAAFLVQGKQKQIRRWSQIIPKLSFPTAQANEQISIDRMGIWTYYGSYKLHTRQIHLLYHESLDWKSLASSSKKPQCTTTTPCDTGVLSNSTLICGEFLYHDLAATWVWSAGRWLCLWTNPAASPRAQIHLWKPWAVSAHEASVQCSEGHQAS